MDASGLSLNLSIAFPATLHNAYSVSFIFYIVHPYKTTGKILVIYNLILIFLDTRWEYKSFWRE
jgi:hypothetical protein